jgi:hypothetical protein
VARLTQVPAVRSESGYWFRARRYGWGWGPPSSWQGWLVLIAYLGALLLGVVWLRSTHRVELYLALVTGLSVVLLGICWWKGEPPRWP